MADIRLRDVFTPGGLPSVTYVKRERLELEDKLRDTLARGFAFTVVTGPTKSGKSVLCKRVLENDALITIEGGQIKSEADFWTHAAYQLNIASTATKTRSEATKSTLTGEGGAEIPLVLKAKAGASRTKEDQQTETANYTSVPVIATIDKLLKTQASLLVDDFHYISSETQKSIIQSLKGAVFRGLSVFLLAVPHRAFDPLTVENEVEGRFKHISIPQWSLEDLVQIPNQGFSALNVKVERSVQRQICEDSFGNPLLVQEICSELCLKNGIREASADGASIKGESLESVYRDMAESKGFPTYQNLSNGPKGRKARQRRVMASGEQHDIYVALLSAIARLGPKPETSLEAIRQSLIAVHAPGGPMPHRGEVVSALVNMSEVAKTRSQGEPPLEWVEDRTTLVITDPFLLFYLKWSFQSVGSGKV